MQVKAEIEETSASPPSKKEPRSNIPSLSLMQLKELMSYQEVQSFN
jgi:hypothetical protein